MFQWFLCLVLSVYVVLMFFSQAHQHPLSHHTRPFSDIQGNDDERKQRSETREPVHACARARGVLPSNSGDRKQRPPVKLLTGRPAVACSWTTALDKFTRNICRVTQQHQAENPCFTDLLWFTVGVCSVHQPCETVTTRGQ